ncbi:MAG TPA: sugar phosphate nucleotidyltransferase [Chthoniobacterales bacterium]|nr:sugar phosphate nucleotidyltransferase [Chthoniobacterales bacterium]
MWGIIPAAGEGKRIQPLAFSKELLPIGFDQLETQKKPRAVSDFIVERLIIAGATKICFVISSSKSDILRYHGPGRNGALFIYLVQPQPLGLCDAVFRPIELIPDAEQILIGLPDTVWFPTDGFRLLPDHALSFLLFPVTRPEHFDAVVVNRERIVELIQVKQQNPMTNYIWGAIKLNTEIYQDLYRLWLERERKDEFLGTLVNAWLARGGRAYGIQEGSDYLDIGTIDGFHLAFSRLMNGYPAVSTSKPTE